MHDIVGVGRPVLASILGKVHCDHAHDLQEFMSKMTMPKTTPVSKSILWGSRPIIPTVQHVACAEWSRFGTLLGHNHTQSSPFRRCHHFLSD